MLTMKFNDNYTTCNGETNAQGIADLILDNQLYRETGITVQMARKGKRFSLVNTVDT